MSEFRYDAQIDERGKTFALWLAHEAKKSSMMAGIQNGFVSVGQAIENKQPVDDAHVELLYGAMRGHAKAWGYLEDYQVDPKLYLSHYLVAVMEREAQS